MSFHSPLVFVVFVTYPVVASDSEWRVTQQWRSIKVFFHNSLYINRVFLLLCFSSLYHRINTRFSPKYYSNSVSDGSGFGTGPGTPDRVRNHQGTDQLSKSGLLPGPDLKLVFGQVVPRPQYHRAGPTTLAPIKFLSSHRIMT